MPGDGAEDAVAHARRWSRRSEPRSLNASAEPASRTNCARRHQAGRRAPCVAMMNADEPAISVRSRSKNAALGPAPIIRR